jgi:hypothetical protein
MTVELDELDLLAINNALNEVLHGADAIEEWEFHTRMGVTRDEARRTLQKITPLVPDLDAPG